MPEIERQHAVIDEITTTTAADVACARCEACCCRLEVMLITDTGVPDACFEEDEWGGWRMARLEDGWCAALNRNDMTCGIYDNRPQICHDFEMGGYECIAERAAGYGSICAENTEGDKK